MTIFVISLNKKYFLISSHDLHHTLKIARHIPRPSKGNMSSPKFRSMKSIEDSTYAPFRGTLFKASMSNCDNSPGKWRIMLGQLVSWGSRFSIFAFSGAGGQQKSKLVIDAPVQNECKQTSEYVWTNCSGWNGPEMSECFQRIVLKS